MKSSFKSYFKHHIKDFIKQKRAVGRSYEESERILNVFDAFCCEHFPEEKNLTVEVGLKWAEIKDTESRNGFRNRLIPVRELAKYMTGIGLQAYVIPFDLAPKGPKYVPHIYTAPELSTIFSVYDQIPFKRNFPIRHLVIPVLFRLVYCCGLRPGEGRKLLRENIDLKSGQVNILEAKGHKDRVVVMADDLLGLCRLYDKMVDRIQSKRRLFFPDSSGNLYTRTWMQDTFRNYLAKTGLTFSGNVPRTYDFRHTFATNTLYRWLREGKDLNVYLPYLSAYLGHSQLSDTAYYIHLVRQHFPQISDMYLNIDANLIPDIDHEN